MEWSINCCSGCTFGWSESGKALSPFAKHPASVGLACKYDNVNLGAKWDANWTFITPTSNVWTFYFNHANGDSTVGSELSYNQDQKKFAAQLGLALKQDNHTWKFRFADTGLLRAAVQWNLHQKWKATLNSSVNFRDVQKGSIGRLPWGLALEYKH